MTRIFAHGFTTYSLPRAKRSLTQPFQVAVAQLRLA